MMSDVHETKKPTEELLKAAIPDNIKKNVGAAEINELIKSSKKMDMTSEDFSKFILIENLPSKYLRYPEATKLYGKPLDIKQLKKLANINVQNATSTIDDILRGALKGIEFDNILVNDKLYLTLWLRANTYPESGYSVPFICPDCNEQTSFDFKVENIGINYIRDDINFEEPFELSTGDFVVFKYPTVKDEQRIVNFKDSVRKSYTKYDDDTLALVMTIDTINGKKMSIMEEYNFISDVKVYSQIKGYITDFDFGISDVLSVKCNKCGGAAQVGLSFREDFVIPLYRSAKHSRNGIQDK